MNRSSRSSAPILALAAFAVAAAAALGAPRAAEPVPPLDLAALLAEAGERSPGVRAALERFAAAEHAPSQAEALPDPWIEASYTNESLDDWTLGDSPDSNLTVKWTQELPYPGKRRLAGDVARAEAGLAASAIEIVSLDAVARVKLAYLDLRRIDRLRPTLEDNRKLLVTLRDLAQARVEAGTGNVEEVLRAGAEVARFDAELAKLAGERREAEAALAGALGRTTASEFGRADEPLEIAPIDPASLEAEILERSPQVAALRAVERRDAGRLEASRRALKPDFMWTAAYAERGGFDPMVMGGFGVRLPLFRSAKQGGAVLQAERELEASRLDIEAATVAIVAEARALVARIEAAAVHHRILEQAAVPLARAALDACCATFEAGRSDFTTTLYDLRSLAADKRAIEETEAERLTALAALEPLTGRELIRPAGANHDRP